MSWSWSKKRGNAHSLLRARVVVHVMKDTRVCGPLACRPDFGGSDVPTQLRHLIEQGWGPGVASTRLSV